MTNYPISSIEEAADIETINMYNERRSEGYTEAEILRSINAKGRDNARTPMQWNSTKNAGFTKGNSWLHVNPNYHEINAEKELREPNPVFKTYQQLIRLRKENPLVVWGDYQLIEATEAEVFAYLRSYENDTWLIVGNFSGKQQPFSLEKLEVQQIIIKNTEIVRNELKDILLEPYETFVAKVKQI